MDAGTETTTYYHARQDSSCTAEEPRNPFFSPGHTKYLTTVLGSTIPTLVSVTGAGGLIFSGLMGVDSDWAGSVSKMYDFVL